MSRRNTTSGPPTPPPRQLGDGYPSQKYTGEKAREAGRNVLALIQLLHEWKLEELAAQKAAGGTTAVDVGSAPAAPAAGPPARRSMK